MEALLQLQDSRLQVRLIRFKDEDVHLISLLPGQV